MVFVFGHYHGEEADDEEWALVSEDGENFSQGKLQVIMHTQERNSDDHTFIGISYSLVDPSVNVVRHGTKQRVPAKLWWLFVPKKKLLHHHPSTQQTECQAEEMHCKREMSGTILSVKT